MKRKTVARILFWTVWIAVFMAGLFGLIWTLVFRFRNPDLSETRLFEKLWAVYAGVVAAAFACSHWWSERPKGD